MTSPANRYGPVLVGHPNSPHRTSSAVMPLPLRVLAPGHDSFGDSVKGFLRSVDTSGETRGDQTRMAVGGALARPQGTCSNSLAQTTEKPRDAMTAHRMTRRISRRTLLGAAAGLAIATPARLLAAPAVKPERTKLTAAIPVDAASFLPIY